MISLSVLGTFALILAALAVIAWQAGNLLRICAAVVRFNIAGDGPMHRLFPNLAFVGLCALILKLTWF
ncbi:hypothetical protein [Tateyamaria sp. SN6-1]|uniref:hypothetical protein n=1 Tax=Tateyamaria sp. SN6-1 TaxID=3092148 RepID=UPI0039F63ECD